MEFPEGPKVPERLFQWGGGLFSLVCFLVVWQESKETGHVW